MANWIPALYQLPAKSGEYLCMMQSGHASVLYYSAKWKAFNAFDELPDCSNALWVDYWMPLPPPPEVLADG